MARKTKQEALETRANILTAALNIFYTYGVANTSLADIAEAAGVTRGAVYWHFKNKQDLILALHDEVHTSFLGKLKPEDERPDQNPLAQLTALCTDTLNEIQTDPDRQKFFAVFLSKCDYAGDLATLLDIQNKQKAEMLALTQDLFRKAIAQGLLPKSADANLLAIALFCYVGGILHEYFRNPGLIDLKKNAHALITLFFKTIASK